MKEEINKKQLKEEYKFLKAVGFEDSRSEHSLNRSLVVSGID